MSKVMAANIYQAVKQAMQDLVAPQLESLQGEIVALRVEMQGGCAAARAETASVRTGVRALEDKLTVALELRERLVALEAKLGL